MGQLHQTTRKGAPKFSTLYHNLNTYTFTPTQTLSGMTVYFIICLE